MDQLTNNTITYALAACTYAMVMGSFGYYVATTKHRAWHEGVTFGLLLSPLGIIALACLPTLEPVRPIPKGAGLRASRDDENDDKMARYRERKPPNAK